MTMKRRRRRRLPPLPDDTPGDAVPTIPSAELADRVRSMKLYDALPPDARRAVASAARYPGGAVEMSMLRMASRPGMAARAVRELFGHDPTALDVARTY